MITKLHLQNIFAKLKVKTIKHQKNIFMFFQTYNCLFWKMQTNENRIEGCVSLSIHFFLLTFFGNFPSVISSESFPVKLLNCLFIQI